MSMESTRLIEGHEFVYTGSLLSNGKLFLKCASPGWQPLCVSVETAWSYGPDALVDSITQQHGQSFEGVVGFCYNKDYPIEDYPNEVRSPDGVTADFLDEEVTVTEAYFKTFVATFARVYFDMADSLNIDVRHLDTVRNTISSW